jgi:DNA-binding MarR family transcriptional regulator
MTNSSDKDTDLTLSHLIGLARQEIFRARKEELDPFDITPMEASVLSIIVKYGNNATIKLISRLTSRESHTISEQLTRMERKGLITKNKHSPTSILKRFKITNKGRIAIDFVNKTESIQLHRIISVLSKEERQQMILMLEKLVNNAINIRALNTNLKETHY